MKDETILKKVIEKSVKNGWEKRGADRVVVEVERFSGIKEIGLKTSTFEHIYFVLSKNKGSKKIEVDLENLIFSPDWAKAFWGEGEEIQKDGICLHCNKKVELSNPSGFCNHVHYPESCDICSAKEKDWQDNQHTMLDEVQAGRSALKYLEKFL